jgi:hypothetical protein
LTAFPYWLYFFFAKFQYRRVFFNPILLPYSPLKGEVTYDSLLPGGMGLIIAPFSRRVEPFNSLPFKGRVRVGMGSGGTDAE